MAIFGDISGFCGPLNWHTSHLLLSLDLVGVLVILTNPCLIVLNLSKMNCQKQV